RRRGRHRDDDLDLVARALLQFRRRGRHRGLADHLADQGRDSGRDRRRGRHHPHLLRHPRADGRFLVPRDGLALRAVMPEPRPDTASSRRSAAGGHSAADTAMTTEAQTDPPMQWFIVNTFSGYENTVKKSLEDRIKANSLEECFEEILVPSEQVLETRGKRKVKQTRKFFPGYLFVRMKLTKEAWHLVKNTPKVTGFLSSGKTPKPVSQSEKIG